VKSLLLGLSVPHRSDIHALVLSLVIAATSGASPSIMPIGADGSRAVSSAQAQTFAERLSSTGTRAAH